ncbi:MAG: hypothetical protein LBR43_02560 [Spiroplasmataceae bacterium]|jgi:hypothetical protein|nr:hypothetical protein [Spiroplasmataceae bacterium]MDR1670578.1 hypothetical protein [Spiroplasmataceae bacterium]
MAKIISEENNESSNNKRDYINREDYEYTLKSTFYNGTILIAVISIYATFAYITISYLQSKKTN